MRDYHWSSCQEYAGTHWVVDASTVLVYFGSFEAFDAHQGNPDNVVRDRPDVRPQDDEILAHAMKLAGVSTSSELRSLPRPRRNELIRTLSRQGVRGKLIARTFGIGTSTVSRVLRT